MKMTGNEKGATFHDASLHKQSQDNYSKNKQLNQDVKADNEPSERRQYFAEYSQKVSDKYLTLKGFFFYHCEMEHCEMLSSWVVMFKINMIKLKNT